MIVFRNMPLGADFRNRSSRDREDISVSMQNGGYHGKTTSVSKANNINRTIFGSMSVDGNTEISESSICIRA